MTDHTATSTRLDAAFKTLMKDRAMTDHTAIIERMARAMAASDGLDEWPVIPVESKRRWLARAQAALSASGLLEVLEKAEAQDKARGVIYPQINTRPGGSAGVYGGCGGDTRVDAERATSQALRIAIKGVRDGK